MKKFFASVLCLGMIVSSALLFTGCGSDIYVDGDFSREATEEEVGAVLREVEAGDVFGDTAAEGWSYGMNILGDMNMKMNISVGGKLMTAADADVDMDMKAVFDGGGLAASGSISAVMTTETPKLGAEEEDATQKSTMRVSGEAYIDGEAFYLDGTLSSSSGDEKTDIEESGKFLVPGGFDLSSVGVSFPDQLTMERNILGALRDAGAKIYIDGSDAEETKVKVSYDVNAVLSQLPLPGSEELQTLIDAIRFDCYDIYFSFVPETGVVTAFGTVIEVSIPETTIGEGETAVTVSLEESGSTWYLAEDVTVEAPADLADYKQL